MKHQLTLILQYYRTLWLYNISFTLVLLVITGFGAGLNPAVLFLCKVFGFGAGTLLHYYSAGKTYFYYRNAGINIKNLLVYAAVMDVVAGSLIIIPLSIILYLCRH